MKLKVNGDPYETTSTTLRQLLNELKVNAGRVAIEINYSVIKRDHIDAVALNEGDEIEIVNFVGGGASLH